MSDLPKPDLAFLTDVIEIRGMEQLALSQLLERQGNQKNHHLVQKVRMGGVSSYLTSVTLGWVAENVRFADDLPIFVENSEPLVRFRAESEEMTKVRPSQLDWRRQLQMVTDLATHERSKLVPLLVVGYRDWVDQPGSDKWGFDKTALYHSLNLKGLEPNGVYWDIEDTETEFYAFEGQYRLMAVLGLRELVQTGTLPARDRNGKRMRSGGLSSDEIVEHLHNASGEDPTSIRRRLRSLMDEQIGVEIVPAVHMGETYCGALQRLRRTFVDVNERYRASGSSESAELEEGSGYQMVCRKLLSAHDLLASCETSRGNHRSIVEPAWADLPEKSDYYTTLSALAETTRRYLRANKSLRGNRSFSCWDRFAAKNIFVRPEEYAVDQGRNHMVEYFDHLAMIPSHRAFIQGRPASDMRNPDGEDNILFRPLVQIALADVLGDLACQGELLGEVIETLGRQEERGQLRLTLRSAPWFGVLCDHSGELRLDAKTVDLCYRMLLYLLGAPFQDSSEYGRLKRDFAAARRIDKDEDSAIDIEGNLVKSGDVELPGSWR